MCCCIKVVRSQASEMSGKDFFSLERSPTIPVTIQTTKKGTDWIMVCCLQMMNLKVLNQIFGRKALCG